MSAIKILVLHLAVMACGAAGALLYPIGAEWMVSVLTGPDNQALLDPRRVSLSGFLLGAFLAGVGLHWLWRRDITYDIEEDTKIRAVVRDEVSTWALAERPTYGPQQIPEHLIPDEIARNGEGQNAWEVDARIRAGVAHWAQVGSTDTIPADMLADCSCSCRDEPDERLVQIQQWANEEPGDEEVPSVTPVMDEPGVAIKPPEGTPTA